MSMLTAHFSNLCMTPAIVKKLLGFRVTPAIQAAQPNTTSNNSGGVGGASTSSTSSSSSSSSSSNQAAAGGSTTSMDTSNSLPPGHPSLPSSPSNLAAAAAAAAASNLDISPSSVCSSSSASSSCASSPASLLLKNSSTAAADSQQAHNKMCEKAIRALVKKLRKTPGAIDELERAITTRDPMTKCIIVPIAKPTGGPVNTMISRKTLPHVVYCRIWRFADLQSSNELKSLPHCQYGYNHAHHHQTATTSNNSSSNNNKLNDEQMVCINPYHYQRVECPTGQQQSQQHQPLTVYVPAKLQLSQQQSQQQQAAAGSSSSTTQASMMDGIMSSVGQLIGVGGGGGGSMQDELMSGVSASSFMHSSNMMRPINSPSPPSSASILSPSSIGSNGGLNSQFSPFISEDDASEINSLISPSPPLMTNAFGGPGTSSLHHQNSFDNSNHGGMHHHHHHNHHLNTAAGSPMDLLPVPMVPQPYWCSISYYEMKQRVGEMFHVAATVNSVTIDGYTDPSSAQRFCLGVLSNVNRSQEVEMTRHYIGRGLMLSYENGQVFAECLSENPVFVQSPNCNQRYNWHLATVVKIPPKCSLKIFDEADFVQVANETVYQGFEAVYALTRICTIRISFVKGWGAEYRRQTILNTPCWIEVHLNNPLKLVDQILTKMGSPRTIATSVS